MKSKQKAKIIIVVLGILFAMSTISNYIFSDNYDNSEDNVEIRDEPNLNHPKKSGVWTLYDITIDDNGGDFEDYTWSEALEQDWCTYENGYYIIENVTFIGHEYGLIIRDSDKNFIIRNCIAQTVTTDLSCIYLENTNNGALINNNCSSSNIVGIWLGEYCSNNIISGNTIFNNEIGIAIDWYCDDNIITENYLYFNTKHCIELWENSVDNNLIERNVMVSEDEKFIYDGGTNTTINMNYELTTPPQFYVESIDQSFSTTEFIIIINVSSEIRFDFSIQSIQMWWNGTIVPSNNITDLGNSLYSISLIPIFIEPGEDPILLNMTILEAHHEDKYFELKLAIESEEVEEPPPLKQLNLNIMNSIYTSEWFNFTVEVINCSGDRELGVELSGTWNGIDIIEGIDIINNSDGTFDLSLEAILVPPDSPGIWLNLTAAKDGYENGELNIEIAVEQTPLLEVPKRLKLNIMNLIYTSERFNFTVEVTNCSGVRELGVELSGTWNGVDLNEGIDIIDNGDGIFDLILEAILVPPGSPGIWLNLTATKDGYENGEFNSKIAVDPNALIKIDGNGNGPTPDDDDDDDDDDENLIGFLGPTLIMIGVVSTISVAVLAIYLLKKKGFKITREK